MWQKIKAACLHSATIAITYITMALGFVVNNIDSLSSVVGTDDFKQNLSIVVGNDPIILGRWMMVISIIVFLGRLRSLWPSKGDQ